MSEGWSALAEAVSTRRRALGLRQNDLESQGGPSGGTVRNIEQAAREKYSPRTMRQLEHALRWLPGAAEKLVAGEISAAALLDDGAWTMPPTETPEWVHQQLPGHAPKWVRQQPPTQAQGGDRLSAAEALALLPPGTLESARGGAVLPPANAHAALIAATRPGFEAFARQHDLMANLLGEGMARALEQANSTLATLRATTAAAQLIGNTPIMRLTPLITVPNIEVFAVPYHLTDEGRAESEAVRQQPWYDPEAGAGQQMARYRAERRTARERHDDDAPTEETDNGNQDAGAGGDEPAEVILGPWGVIVATETKDVADVDDLALAGELFARLSRRPKSEARDAQLRAVNSLIGELVQESPDRQLDAGRQTGDRFAR